MNAHDGVRAMNRAALVLAALLLLALGVAWAWSRLRPVETPRWLPARFVELRPATASEARERWIVAVHPGCPSCERHLAWLSARVASRAAHPALGVLVVDQPTRPSAVAFGDSRIAGVWWDSAGVWRRAWGRGRYGETYRFGPGGELLGVSGVERLPDSLARR